jgi:F-type H+-transporting ATPase subunit a
MRVANFFLVLVALMAGLLSAGAAQEHASTVADSAVAVAGTVEAAAADVHHDASGHGEHHGLPPAAPILFEVGFFKVNNSMVITWIVALVLIVAAQMATRKIQLVPSGLQNFFEWMVESLYDFLEGIIGADLVKKTFWFFATIFIFILFTNWFGLIPGVGTLLYHDNPILRGGNADLNMTSAMAITFFACWIFWALKANGPVGFFKHIFVYSGDATGATRGILILVFLAVGLLEVISILFRPVSLSFRLYGNIFAGENLLESMALMGGKYFGWLVPLPFYFMELIVGLVQALVFMLLTAIFTQLICSHGDEHHAEHGEKEAHH